MIHKLEDPAVIRVRFTRELIYYSFPKSNLNYAKEELLQKFINPYPLDKMAASLIPSVTPALPFWPAGPVVSALKTPADPPTAKPDNPTALVIDPEALKTEAAEIVKTFAREAVLPRLKTGILSALSWGIGKGRLWTMGGVGSVLVLVLVGVVIQNHQCCQDLDNRVAAQRDLLAIHHRWLEEARGPRLTRASEDGSQVYRRLLAQGYSRWEALRILREPRPTARTSQPPFPPPELVTIAWKFPNLSESHLPAARTSLGTETPTTLTTTVASSRSPTLASTMDRRNIPRFFPAVEHKDAVLTRKMLLPTARPSVSRRPALWISASGLTSTTTIDPTILRRVLCRLLDRSVFDPQLETNYAETTTSSVLASSGMTTTFVLAPTRGAADIDSTRSTPHLNSTALEQEPTSPTRIYQYLSISALTLVILACMLTLCIFVTMRFLSARKRRCARSRTTRSDQFAGTPLICMTGRVQSSRPLSEPMRETVPLSGSLMNPTAEAWDRANLGTTIAV